MVGGKIGVVQVELIRGDTTTGRDAGRLLLLLLLVARFVGIALRCC